ncbi:MAG: hypothetical protein P9M00_09115 [Candidatus Tritonobacter lacicola]|nr:hypothetical protein [Candidatus Tritonobacter lacicola]
MTFSDEKWVLMLDDPSSPHVDLRDSLVGHNFRLNWTDSPDEALRAVREEPVDLGLIGLGRDVRRGLFNIRRIRSASPKLAIIAISPFFITELIMKLIELDTYSFLVEPVNFIDLERLILRAFERINEEGDF